MKMKKIFVALCIFAIILSIFNIAFGADVGSVISQMEGKAGPSHAGEANVGGMQTAIQQIVGALQLAGSGIALIMITWAGFKYMMASADAKADIKKQILPIVIGAVLLFGAVALVGIMQTAGENFGS